jgi:hypothetical protein
MKFAYTKPAGVCSAELGLLCISNNLALDRELPLAIVETRIGQALSVFSLGACPVFSQPSALHRRIVHTSQLIWPRIEKSASSTTEAKAWLDRGRIVALAGLDALDLTLAGVDFRSFRARVATSQIRGLATRDRSSGL